MKDFHGCHFCVFTLDNVVLCSVKLAEERVVIRSCIYSIEGKKGEAKSGTSS